MFHYYCSIASSDYIYKVLALYNSMVKHDKKFKFFIICMNEEVIGRLKALGLENAELIPIQDIEAVYPELIEIRKIRNNKEYAWTVKPSAIMYILGRNDYIDHILWLDGDTMFLSDPSPIYSEWGQHSILLTEERYSGKYEFMSRIYGVYNTGLLGFKRDANSFECLKWLQARLNEWCYDRMENGLWSDQMYVNDWPQRFKDVRVIKNLGINMTPFILWRLTLEEKSSVVARNEGVYVRNNRLILFHYYGFRYKNSNKYDLCYYRNWKFSAAVVQSIYKPYINAYEAALKKINKVAVVKADKNYSTHCFCTLVTLEYLPKCLALLASIEKNTDSFHLWICCIDDMAYDILSRMQLKNVTLLKISEIENESLRAVKGRRKKYEYCWTVKAPLIRHIFENYENAASLLYVDSDIFLFSKPDLCFNLLKEYPVFLTCHNFSQSFKHLYKGKGRFNAGIIGFKRCNTAERYLKWWQKKCIEWCYDTVSEGRFADQKYIEEFANPHVGAYIANNLGMNGAVWNVKDAAVRLKNEDILIDDSLLVFYHFSSFLVLSEHEFDLWKWDRLGINDSKIKLIYMPYAEAIAKSIQTIKPYIDDISEIFADVDSKYQTSNLISIGNLE